MSQLESTRVHSDPSWLSELRSVHDQALETDWATHLVHTNERYGFTGDSLLSTAQIGAPPAWFNGDVEAISGARWILVMSLNPQKPPEGHYKGSLTPATAWNFWRTHNRDYWYTRFFRPLVRLAAISLGEPIPRHGAEEQLFASRRMIFVELCPYASKSFGLTSDQLSELAAEDPAFSTARQIRNLLIQSAIPELILVNGQSSMDEFERHDSERLEWRRRDYQLTTRSGRAKAAWHMEGWYSTPGRAIPTIGFKFLNKPSNHNGNLEIDQLGESISSFVHSG